jgi:hypothetical protein
VDDFAGEKHLTIGKALARLIGVVDSPIDAVAETKLACEVHEEAAGRELVLRFLDRGDQPAAVAAGQDMRDFVFEIEALIEKKGRKRDTREDIR